jgi:O-antigen/teichoic acid export membrane protein
MKLFQRPNQRFVEQALDETKREEAISTLAKLQIMLLWLTLPAVLVAAVMMFFGDRPSSGLVLWVLVIMSMLTFNKLDSDRKLLLILRQLDKR